MGRGSSGAKSILTAKWKRKLTEGIKTHTPSDNDRAQKYYETQIAKEQKIIDNYDNYVRLGWSGVSEGKNTEWWKYHEDTLASLKAQYSYFMKKRKELGR